MEFFSVFGGMSDVPMECAAEEPLKEVRLVGGELPPELQKVYRLWLDAAKKLPPHDAAIFAAKLASLAKTLALRCNQLLTEPSSALQIKKSVEGIAATLNATAQSYFAGLEQYGSKKCVLKAQFDQIDSQIAMGDFGAENFNFQPRLNSRPLGQLAIDPMSFIAQQGAETVAKEVSGFADGAISGWGKESRNDGSIEPISNFLTTPAAETVCHWGVSLAKTVCHSHPVVEKACKSILDLIPEASSSRRPNALVLTASSDHNHAFPLNFFKYNLETFQRIERSYNTKYKKISNANNLCKAIDDEKAHGVAIDLLIIRAHGYPEGIRLGESEYFSENLTVLDNLPKNSCLKNLAPKATIILESCSTGKGRENAYNLANFIAFHAPKDARVFASTEPTYGTKITVENPLEVEFRTVPLFSGEKENPVTYKIDETNREAATDRYRY